LALKFSTTSKTTQSTGFQTYGTAMLRFEDTEIEFVEQEESYHFESRNLLSKTEP
jgi:tRNA nucleotidyltransferase (CCA-adding enzyme)